MNGLRGRHLHRGTVAFVASAYCEITHPAQGAPSGRGAGRTLGEALLCEFADHALSEHRQGGALDSREPSDGAGDRALAGEPDAPRDFGASGSQDRQAGAGVAAWAPCDISGSHKAID
jgi:hypothetical protein